MFAKTIVLSDEFLDMPLSARCLYFTLGMLADDDGFVNSPKSIMRQCGASQDDMRILISKRFIILFESGIIVIKHWRINNYLRNDRYNQTKYLDEKECLSINENGSYHLESQGSGIPGGIPNSGIPSIDKYSIDKNNIYNGDSACDFDGKKADIDKFFDSIWQAYPKKKGKGSISDAKKKKLYENVGLEQMLRCIERYKEYVSGKDEQYIMYGSTFFNSGYVDYLDDNCEQQEYEEDNLPFK
jgi:hypothetical protein